MKHIEVYIKSINVLFELLSEKYEFNGTPLDASGEINLIRILEIFVQTFSRFLARNAIGALMNSLRI